MNQWPVMTDSQKDLKSPITPKKGQTKSTMMSQISLTILSKKQLYVRQLMSSSQPLTLKELSVRSLFFILMWILQATLSEFTMMAGPSKDIGSSSKKCTSKFLNLLRRPMMLILTSYLSILDRIQRFLLPRSKLNNQNSSMCHKLKCKSLRPSLTFLPLSLKSLSIKKMS